jgi:hypothetical protein
LRLRAADTVDFLLAAPNILVVAQTRESFLTGLELYRHRPDKGYSLTDCVSMQTMRRLNIDEVLTNDRHFGQEGFGLALVELDSPLLPSPPAGRCEDATHQAAQEKRTGLRHIGDRRVFDHISADGAIRFVCVVPCAPRIYP